jgi:hypothetical protein
MKTEIFESLPDQHGACDRWILVEDEGPDPVVCREHLMRVTTGISIECFTRATSIVGTVTDFLNGDHDPRAKAKLQDLLEKRHDQRS